VGFLIVVTLNVHYHCLSVIAHIYLRLHCEIISSAVLYCASVAQDYWSLTVRLLQLYCKIMLLVL